MSAPTLSRQHRIRRGALIIALTTCLGAALVSCSDEAEPAAGQSAASPAADTQLARLTQQAADTGSLGVIVRVDSGDGKPVEIAKQAAWTKDDHRLAAGDRFRVGSNTKTVTATLVLQQVAQQKISLDDTVEKWLPGLVKGGGHITVRMLLNHTSGLGDFLLTPQFLPSLTGQEKRTWTPQELLAITPEQDPPAEPGETYSYSNANYEALGLILEKATGSSLAELIEQKITKPLGMKDSYLATNADWGTGKNRGKQHVTGYEPDAARLKQILSATVDLPDGVGFAGPERPDDNVDTAAIDPSWSWAAGGMVSTAADWQTFLTALNSGELLPETQLKQMRTTVDAPEEGGGYGLGLMRVDTACGTVWGHTGGLPGYSSEIYTDATGTRSVAVLTSTNFGIKEKKAAATNKALVDAATCQMLGKPQPSDSPTG
ncbi:serine hydrolase domain-containing protein [Streptomyces sp. NRRL F-5650]|jgi:D-alanyl-D-alanine carboxypeptidase|uniref:serine hydrolase domain-containing protein n=1 Tax=Streptomyces sp. NRRL F-5650 TaxID=1463868 RepID=UPI000B3015AA|nr:serine hydrolase domain-containing protein [Streptomyces sp. NRRL F-5650]